MPEPQTAIHMAKDRRFSKYTDTATMAGKYAIPRPNPIQQILHHKIHIVVVVLVSVVMLGATYRSAASTYSSKKLAYRLQVVLII